ncbi:hypothetical protein ACVMH6_001931 [Rhizobium leguminosarum]
MWFMEPRITPREKEVLTLMCEGKSAQEIAIILGCSVYTVRTHIGRLKDEFNVYRHCLDRRRFPQQDHRLRNQAPGRWHFLLQEQTKGALQEAKGNAEVAKGDVKDVLKKVGYSSTQVHFKPALVAGLKRVALAIAAVAVGLLTKSASAQTTEDPAVNACKNTGLLALRDGREDRHSLRGLHRPEGKDRKAGQVRMLAPPTCPYYAIWRSRPRILSWKTI